MSLAPVSKSAGTWATDIGAVNDLPTAVPTRDQRPTIIEIGNTNIVRLEYGIQSAPPRKEAAKMPAVDVATIGKTASTLVFLVCALSFLVWLTTGFAFIYPPMSLLIAGFAIVFFIVAKMLEAQWKR